MRATEVYAEALQVYESIEHNDYDFNKGLQLVQRYIRIPQLLNRVVLEDTVREISSRIEEMIQAEPNENREIARQIVRAAAEAFSPYYRNNRKVFLENLFAAQLGATCVIDLHSLFADNSERLAKFLTDVLTVALSRDQLGGLAELIALVIASSKLPFKELTEHKEQPSSTESTPTIPQPPPGLASLVQSMADSGISKDTASRVFDMIGFQVGGTPGRHAIDYYSRAYELKASNSWTELARRYLLENADVREEFGGRDFDSLTFEEQHNLTHRIRVGVKSYAKRMEKPFPVKSVRATRDPSGAGK